MRLTKEPLTKPAIDMIPLMDSMFLLLVFFIYTMMIMTVNLGIPLALPGASSAVITPNHKIVMITIDRSGAYFLDTIPVTISQLSIHLGDKAKDHQVMIRADHRTGFSYVVSVLDMCRTLGIETLSIETDPVTP